MSRRAFIKNSILSGAGLVAGTTAMGSTIASATSTTAEKPFNLKFAPDFNVFRELGGKDVVDHIKWGYDAGFRAWESTFLKDRSIQDQERISKTMLQLGMQFGLFAGTVNFKEVTFAGNNTELRDKVIQDVKNSVEMAKRMNTKFVHNILGLADRSLQYEFQLLNATELLKRIAEIYEPHGIVMVMEPMNHKVNHGGMFLHTVPQAYALAKMVDSPSVKILYDCYHVQIQEGNLLPLMDATWSEIAYIQVGDTPGRTEPTTGEINYPNVLKHLYNKGYRGFIGLEHRIKNPGKAGELAALQAYRSIDVKL